MSKTKKNAMLFATGSSKKRKSRRAHKKLIMNIFLPLLMNLWMLIHSIIDSIIDFLFGLYYDSKKNSAPPVSTPLVMESAISLAQKIRNKEDQFINIYEKAVVELSNLKICLQDVLSFTPAKFQTSLFLCLKSETGSEEVSCEEVVQSFINRIQEVNPIINAVIDECYTSALEVAKEVDKNLADDKYSTSELIANKPFLGVPFTTKESTACKGMLHSLGLLSRRNVRATEDADIVLLMKEAGAILIAVTSVPEINLWCETRNHLIGQTKNPYNSTRTTGGSSGGEASIISASASPIGLGTDIGGSIRIPAYCCGIFGHKPTSGLAPLKGLTFRTGEEHNTMVTPGPMTKYACDLSPLLKVLIGKNCNKLHLDDEVDLKNVNYFFIDELGDKKCSNVGPEMLNALMSSVQHFEELTGKPVEKLEIPGLKHSYKLWRYWMSKEPSCFEKDLADRKGYVSVWNEVPKKLIGQSNFTLASIIKLIDNKLPPVNAKWAEDLTQELSSELLKHLDKNGVLLFPSNPFPAGYHFTTFLRPYNFSYCAAFNVLKLPVTQVPLGLGKSGLPVGVQIISAPYNDHLCIAVAKELEKTFGGWVPPFPVK